MKLSIGIMVKNEEAHLRNCLGALMPLLEELSGEIVVLDTGSTDSSKEIARSFTDKVYERAWNDDFGAMRNHLLEFCSGEWFFWVDADEVLADHRPVVAFLSSEASTKYNAASLTIRNWTILDDADPNWVDARLVRLFRRTKGLRFEGAIHEQPIFSGPFVELDAILNHYGYINNDPELMERKFERNKQILLRELSKDKYNVYYWFQLSQTYSMHKDPMQAKNAIDHALELCYRNGLAMDSHMYVLITKAKVEFRLSNYHECIRYCRKALSLREGYLDLYYFLGVSHFYLQQYDEALFFLHRFLDYFEGKNRKERVLDMTTPEYSVSEVDSVYRLIGLILLRTGDFKAATEYSRRIRKAANLAVFLSEFIDVYYENGMIVELNEFYRESVTEAVRSFFIERLWSCVRKHIDSISEAFVEQSWDDPKLDRFCALSRGLLHRKSGTLDADNQEFSASWSGNRCALQLVLYVLMNDGTLFSRFASVHSEPVLLEALLAIMSTKHAKRMARELLEDLGESIDDTYSRMLLLKALFMVDSRNDEEDLDLFLEYLATGWELMRHQYAEQALSSSRNISSANDKFLVQMHSAIQASELSLRDSVRFLREALHYSPEMKRGIELMYREFRKREHEFVGRMSSGLRDELENYRPRVLSAIKKCINEGDTSEAHRFIREYERIFGCDSKLCSTKAVVLLASGEFDEAESLLTTGLRRNPYDVDLLYNMAFLSEINGETKRARRLYTRAMRFSADQQLVEDINQRIRELSRCLQWSQ